MAKVAFMQLSSCWGCHQALLDAHLTLLHVLPELEIVYWPAVVDFKLKDLEAHEDGSIDVGFLEGAVRTEQDKNNALLMRRKCKILVAMGSCAVYGGIPGLANLYSIDELLERKFLDEEFVDKGSKIPDQHVPKILESIPRLDSVVKIDARLPGCPPKTGNIVGLIASALGVINTKVDRSQNMCDVCPISDKCLLDRNILCFGPITAKGDPIGKISEGYPVLGEFGPTSNPNIPRAEILLDMITAAPLKGEAVHQALEAMHLLLHASPLGYLAGLDDPVRGVKLNPDLTDMKKITLPNGQQVTVVNLNREDLPQIVSEVIGATLADLRTNPEYEDSAKTVCSQCERNTVDKQVIRYKRDYEGFPDMDKCLLVQGYVCLGPITRAGCGATCPRANSPCLGCYGPALNVDDMIAKGMSYFPAICIDDPDNIKKFFLDPAGLFGRFTTVVSNLPVKVEEPKKE